MRIDSWVESCYCSPCWFFHFSAKVHYWKSEWKVKETYRFLDNQLTFSSSLLHFKPNILSHIYVYPFNSISNYFHILHRPWVFCDLTHTHKFCVFDISLHIDTFSDKTIQQFLIPYFLHICSLVFLNFCNIFLSHTYEEFFRSCPSFNIHTYNGISQNYVRLFNYRSSEYLKTLDL